MLSFDSSIQKSAETKTQSVADSWNIKNLTPYQQFDKKCKKVQHFSNKWLKTAHLQLSQKSFKTCLGKLTIIAPFIPYSSSFFFFFFLNKKIKKKNQVKFFSSNFSKLSPKRCPGGYHLHPQRPQRVFEEDEAEEATESSSSLNIHKRKWWSTKRSNEGR